MSYLVYTERVEYVLDLISNGKLVSPKQLSDKFVCSERTVRRMINHLRDQGHDISYSKKNGKYLLNI